MDTAVRQIEARDPTQLCHAARTIETLILADRKQFAVSQDAFAHNVAGRLALQLDIALAYPEEAVITFLRLLRGVSLVHRASRKVFDSDDALNTLLQRGVKENSPAVQIAAIDTLVAVMVREVDTIRRFETIGGLRVVCDVFKQSRTEIDVKMAILQFLFFYLVPETKMGTPGRKTTNDKKEVLAKYLSNADGIVRELEMHRPFGNGDLEW